MAEELILTDPVVPPAPPSTTKYTVTAFTMDLEVTAPSQVPPQPGMVNIRLRDNNNTVTYHQYTGNTAVNMIKTLNTANLSTKSMQKRILEKLAADGLLPPGAVQGTPDAPTALRRVDADEEDSDG